MGPSKSQPGIAAGLRESHWVAYAIGLAVIVGVSVLLANYSPNLHDPDSLYHLRHAAIYRAAGIGYAEFPWVQFSVVRTIGADLWYGFHLLIIPLTYFADPVWAARVGDNLTAILSLLLYYAMLRRLQVRWPLFWTLTFLFLTGDVVYRIPVLRPHPLSLMLNLLLYSFLVAPPTTLTAHSAILRSVPVFIIGAAIAWVHILLAWVPILVVLCVAGADFLSARRIDLVKALSVVAGVLTGWLLRPNPVGAARLAYLVLARIPTQIPLNVGTELKPFGWEDFTEQLVPLALLLAVALGLLLWLSGRRRDQPPPRKEQVTAWSSLCIGLIFGVMAFTVARRSNEFLVGFGVLFMGQVCTLFAQQPAALRRQLARQWPARIVAALLVAALAYAVVQSWRLYDFYVSISVPRDELKEAALWLKSHTEKGAIVFNVHWDRFGNLFGWNDHNHYINGMDPIFEYAFDPSLYWKHHFYAVGQGAAFTCGAQHCTSAESVPTHPVLARDFGASYIVVERYRSPQLFAYLQAARGFQQVFATPREAIFKVLP